MPASSGGEAAAPASGPAGAPANPAPGPGPAGGPASTAVGAGGRVVALVTWLPPDGVVVRGGVDELDGLVVATWVLGAVGTDPGRAPSPNAHPSTVPAAAVRAEAPRVLYCQVPPSGA